MWATLAVILSIQALQKVMPAYIEHVVQSVSIVQIVNRLLLHLLMAHLHIRGFAIHLKGVNNYG